MPQRVEEVFRRIAGPARRSSGSPTNISASLTANGSDASGGLSAAAQEIAQLRAQFTLNTQLIAANTDAIQANTHSRSSAGSGSGSSSSSPLSNALGFLSPVAKGIMSLFGLGSSPAPVQLPVYTPPPSISLEGSLSAIPASVTSSAAAPVATTSQPAAAPQITVQVHAMDSQSFMDRSTDIANAVRDAMLNLHPINDVIANL